MALKTNDIYVNVYYTPNGPKDKENVSVYSKEYKKSFKLKFEKGNEEDDNIIANNVADFVNGTLNDPKNKEGFDFLNQTRKDNIVVKGVYFQYSIRKYSLLNPKNNERVKKSTKTETVFEYDE